jgi:hypothetical protein
VVTNPMIILLTSITPIPKLIAIDEERKRGIDVNIEESI